MAVHRHARRAAAVAAGAIVVGFATPVTAASPAPAVSAPSRTAHTLTLVTGDQVVMTTDAAGRTAFTSLPGSSGQLVTYKAGASWYAVPALAAPFLGHQLDKSLFDVSALTQAKAPDAVRVQVDWHGSNAPRLPWLVNATNVGRGQTTGLITQSSGHVLRSALAQQSSTSDTWTGSLAGIDRLSVQGTHAAAPRTATPQAAFYTLTLNGINAAGNKANGDIVNVINTDDSNQFLTDGLFDHGVVTFSVPAGDYSALGLFSHSTPSNTGSTHIVVTDFTVNADTAVTLDARTATSRISVSTPRATYSNTGSFFWQREGVTGDESALVGTSWTFGPGEPAWSTYVTPFPTPKVGTQYIAVGFHMKSPPGTAPYSYDLVFGSVGTIVSNQHYAAAASQLATVQTRYFSDVSGRDTGESRFAHFPWQQSAVSSLDEFPAPFVRTEYVLAQPDLLWTHEVIDDLPTFGGIFFDSSRLYRAGEQTTDDWNRGPIGPGVQVETGAATQPRPCPACSGGNGTDLELGGIFPLGGNPPGHTGFGSNNTPGVSFSNAFSLLRNGVTIASGPFGPPSFVAVPAGPARYRLQYHVTMSAPWWTHSTDTSTQWSFKDPDSMQSPPPAGWACGNGSNVGCKVISLMFPDYALPQNLLGQESAGPTSFRLGIVHNLNVAVPVTGAQVSLSYDGGATWHFATAASNSTGGFRVSYTNPAGPLNVAIRIHVTDTAGGVLDQTILNAYSIA